MRIYCVLLIIGSFLSCQSSDSDEAAGGSENATEESAQKNDAKAKTLYDQSEIEKELDSLSNDSQKITFHRLMIKSDFNARKKQTKAFQTYGFESPEYIEATSIVEQTDKINLSKTVGFVEKFGISDNQSVGRMQANAMWLVISHNSDIEIYRSLYSSFEKSWIMGYLEDSSFSSYLQDYHRLKFGKRLELKNPYRDEEEIKALRKVLEP